MKKIFCISAAALLLSSCTMTFYRTREIKGTDERRMARAMRSNKIKVIHQGDREWELDDPIFIDGKLTGRLLPPLIRPDSVPRPDTLTGDHPWQLKRRPHWLKECHVWIKEGTVLSSDTVVLYLQDLRVARTYNETGDPRIAEAIANDHSSNFFNFTIGLATGALTRSLDHSRSRSSSSGRSQPRGSSGVTRNAGIRSFPKKNNIP